MRKPKIILVTVSILAVISSIAAFKASRGVCNVYTLLTGNKKTSTTIGGIVYTTTIPNCTLTALQTTAFGNPVNVSSTTTNAFSTTVFISAGHPNITTTFPYCTLWFTRTVACGEL